MKNKILIIQDVNDLAEMLTEQIRTVIKEELVNLDKKHKKDERKKYITRKEVCAHFNISYPTLYRFINNEIITCYKVGKRSLFNLKQIEDIMIQKAV